MPECLMAKSSIFGAHKKLKFKSLDPNVSLWNPTSLMLNSKFWPESSNFGICHILFFNGRSPSFQLMLNIQFFSCFCSSCWNILKYFASQILDFRTPKEPPNANAAERLLLLLALLLRGFGAALRVQGLPLFIGGNARSIVILRW